LAGFWQARSEGQRRIVRPQRRTRSTLLGVALLVISLGATAWTAYTISQSSTGHLFPGVFDGGADPSATAGGTSHGLAGTPAAPQATPDYDSLGLSAGSIYMIDGNTQDVIFQREPDTARAPASTAKLVTALTALKYARPEEVVTIQQADVVDPVQESNMGLQVGDTVTVHDLFVGLFLPSGNDAANALARFAGERISDSTDPPVQRFVAAMNHTAADLGMTNSHFVNPSGDDADGQVVTAHDLTLATLALLGDPALRPIVAIPDADVRIGGPNARVVHLTNTNELLLTNGVYGVKTGTTENAGQCLIVAYRTQTTNVIAVILDSGDRYADARKLLDLPPPPATATPTP
jgi:D-alanyl-D-alanine carboxypeptidase (penicillin-binding protein 5/6)